MGVVDRTQEFRQILQDLARKGHGPAVELQEQAANKEQSVLNAAAGELGSEIHQASLKVQELRKMARKKDIFNDKTHDIQVLTVDVKEHIQSLNAKVEQLESRVSGTGPNRAHQAHSSNMIGTLKTRLLEVTKDFKDALEDRTTTMASQDERRKLYSSGKGAASNPFESRQRPACANPDDPEAGGQAVAQMYHNSRAEAVQSVQRTIGELVPMFQKMATMVTAQEEMIQRIDHDIDDSMDNMNAAQDSLLKYFHHISSNRSLIIKVFAILIFFVVFFVVFIAD